MAPDLPFAHIESDERRIHAAAVSGNKKRETTEDLSVTQSNLVPFIRPGLDILFVGLNPAGGSSRNRHYFSVNQAFWNQLEASGLITEPVDKAEADAVVFGSTKVNCHGWSYGITDLVTSIAESNSAKVRPTKADSVRLRDEIIKYKPRAAVLIHGKVLKHFTGFLGRSVPESGRSLLGRIVPASPTVCFTVPFPHGNAIMSDVKIAKYEEIRDFLEKLDRAG